MKRRRERIIIVLLVSITIIFLFTPVFAYDTNVGHRKLTEQAVDLFNMHFGNKISDTNKKFMVEGVIAEDTPIRWMNHFYEPNKNIGLLGFLTAKSWAQNPKVQSLYLKNDQSWQTAIDEFAKGDNKKAFTALGHVLHLIEDMTVPAHTRLDIHVFDGGDPYEQWVKNNYKNTSSIVPTKVSSLDNAFDYLALFSNRNFFSKDTININILVNKNSEKVMHNNIPLNCIYNIDNESNKYCLVLVDEDFINPSKNEYFLHNINHSDYFTLLAPKAISYGAGVIKLFFDTAEPLKEKKASQINNWFANFIDYSKNIFFTIALAHPKDSSLNLRISSDPQKTNQQTPAQTPQTTATPNPTSTIATISLETQEPREEWPESLPEIYPTAEAYQAEESAQKEEPPQEPVQPITFTFLIPHIDYIPSPGNSTPQKPAPKPVPPPAPILNSIFSELVFVSSTPATIFGECSLDTTQITFFKAREQTDSTDNMEEIHKFEASSSAWSTEAPLQYGNNLFYFTAQNNSGQTSELSEPASIIFDNQPPEVAFESISVTSTEESTQIELNFSAFDTFSAQNCFDLQVSVNTSDMFEVLNCANFSQYIFETKSTGEMIFYLRAKDELNNVSEWIATSTVIAEPETPYNYLNGAQTEEEVILTKEGSPYILKNYTVPTGKTLRIESGAIIKGETRRSMIYIEGKLFAMGSPDDPIYFTTVQDRTFGTKKLNTLDLGATREPQAQDWSALFFYYAEGVFENVIFRYGGTDHSYPCLSAMMMCDTNMEVLFFMNSKIFMDNVLIEKTGPGIISSSRTELTILNSTLDGLYGAHKADYAIRPVRGKLDLDNVIFKNLIIGIDARTTAPATTMANMTEDNFLNVDNPWLPLTLISL